MKHRASLQRELVVGDMRGPKREGDPHIVQRLLQGLLRQRIHEIEIEIAEYPGDEFLHRSIRVVGRMNTAQHFKRVRVKALRAQGHAIDTRLGIALELAALNRAWVRLQRDFRAVREVDPLLERTDQAREIRGTEQARRTAAEKYAGDPAPPHARRLEVEIPEQRIDLRGVG